MKKVVEEDRIILHELRGVNIKVDFFLGTRSDVINQAKCVAYSVCWQKVDIRVDLVTFTEQISELDFFYSGQQLYIDDHMISGDIVDFYLEATEPNKLTAFCKIAIGVS